MDRALTVKSPAGKERTVRLMGFPDRCPRCHANVVPKALVAVSKDTEDRGAIEEALQCTNGRCSRVFIASYEFKSVGTAGNPPRFALAKLAPQEPKTVAQPQLVSQLSPTFVETYSQALIAEGYGLEQLTGIGLRKALEFLVKDFAVGEHPGDRPAIIKKTLAACIKDYIADPTVKEIAKRAAWLGNDETHYVRKWEDRDVNDLKVLIRLTVNGIENVLLSRKYIREMPEG